MCIWAAGFPVARQTQPLGALRSALCKPVKLSSSREWQLSLSRQLVRVETYDKRHLGSRQLQQQDEQPSSALSYRINLGNTLGFGFRDKLLLLSLQNILHSWSLRIVVYCIVQFNFSNYSTSVANYLFVFDLMLPSDIRDLKTGGIGQFTADGRFPDYVRRLFDLQQMDFEAAFDQLMSILSWEPQKVYVRRLRACL